MSEEKATYQCSLSAQELRTGNWVYDGERTQFPMQVVALGKDWAHLDFPGNEGDVWEADIKDLLPIPITKEMLDKAGFCYQYLYYRKESGKYEFHWNILQGAECCYLHQLQNAYFMATGEELEIQP